MLVWEDPDEFDFVPSKLAQAMTNALKTMAGFVVVAIETSYAQWQLYAGAVMQAVARRSRGEAGKPSVAKSISTMRRVKAFFVSQKVNGHNAP
jgi:hypothetical protein